MHTLYPVVGYGARALPLLRAIQEPDEGDAICTWCGESFDPVDQHDELCQECHKVEERRIAEAEHELN